MRWIRVRKAAEADDGGEEREIDERQGEDGPRIDRRWARLKDRGDDQRAERAIGHADGIALDQRDPGLFVAHRDHVAERGEVCRDQRQCEADGRLAVQAEGRDLRPEDEGEAGKSQQRARGSTRGVRPDCGRRARHCRYSSARTVEKQTAMQPARHVEARQVEQDVVEREQANALGRHEQMVAQPVTQPPAGWRRQKAIRIAAASRKR